MKADFHAGLKTLQKKPDQQLLQFSTKTELQVSGPKYVADGRQLHWTWAS